MYLGDTTPTLCYLIPTSSLFPFYHLSKNVEATSSNQPNTSLTRNKRNAFKRIQIDYFLHDVPRRFLRERDWHPDQWLLPKTLVKFAWTWNAHQQVAHNAERTHRLSHSIFCCFKDERYRVRKALNTSVTEVSKIRAQDALLQDFLVGDFYKTIVTRPQGHKSRWHMKQRRFPKCLRRLMIGSRDICHRYVLWKHCGSNLGEDIRKCLCRK